MLDSFSQATLISESLVKRMKLKGERKLLQWLVFQQTEELKSQM